MTNAELIKALRRCSYTTVAGVDREDGYCKPCAYYAEDASDITCIDRMMIDAADALEAAEKRIDNLQQTCNKLATNLQQAQLPKEGEWIIKPHGTYGQLRAFCSACGKHSGIGGIVSNQKKLYCPNCGAKMKGEQE